MILRERKHWSEIILFKLRWRIKNTSNQSSEHKIQVCPAMDLLPWWKMNSEVDGKNSPSSRRANHKMVVSCEEASNFVFDFSTLAHFWLFSIWIPKIFFRT